MKKIFYVLAVLAVALYGCSSTEKEEQKTTSTAATGDRVAVAVVNTDSVMANYDFAVQANDELQNKGENARVDLNTKARALQNDMATFQNKMDNNAFLSRQRAESEYNRLQQRQADLQNLESQMSDNLMQEQQRLNKQLHDSIDNAIKELNKDHKYGLIITTSELSQTVLYCDDDIDITQEVIDELNKRWNANKNNKKKE